MSWKKNTLVASSIDNTISVLKELGISYTLTKLGEVSAMGLNDQYENRDIYEIRKLEYSKYVIIEQMVRHPDCDSDDVIYSKKYMKGKEPTITELEKVAAVEGF